MRLFIKDCLEGKHSDLICLLTYLAEPVSTKDLRSIATTLGWSTRELNAAKDFLPYAEIIETRWISYSDRSYGIEPDFFFHAATYFIKTRGDLLEGVRSHVLFDNHDPAILENLLSLATNTAAKAQRKSTSTTTCHSTESSLVRQDLTKLVNR